MSLDGLVVSKKGRLRRMYPDHIRKGRRNELRGKLKAGRQVGRTKEQRNAMGALCSYCKGGHGVLEDDQVEMTKTQRKAGQPPPHWRKKVSKAETEEDRAKAAEAKKNAGLAGQRRQEAYEKSAAGRARRKIAEELAKPALPPNRGEPALRWQMG